MGEDTKFSFQRDQLRRSHAWLKLNCVSIVDSSCGLDSLIVVSRFLLAIPCRGPEENAASTSRPSTRRVCSCVSHSLFVSHSLREFGVGRLSSPPLPRGLWDCCQLLHRSRHLAGQGTAGSYHISAVPFPICVPFLSRARSWASVRSAAA